LHHLIAAHVNELVALTVGATRDAAEIARGSGLRAARLVKVLQAIDAGILDAGLSAASVAARLGVTPRYVHLLLEETGQTFSQYILEKRLVRAMRHLRDPRQSGRRIADVAFAVGFGDLSHFNRAFRLRFGNTPSSIRKSAARDEGR
jgi:AraC-like DNA-binding protein